MQSPEDNAPPTRKRRYFIEWLCVVIGFSILGMVVRLSILLPPEWAKNDFNPWGDLPSMIVISFFGWFIPGLIGPLWLILLSLFLVMRTKRRYFFILAGATALGGGMAWPDLFWGMMSV